MLQKESWWGRKDNGGNPKVKAGNWVLWPMIDWYRHEIVLASGMPGCYPPPVRKIVIMGAMLVMLGGASSSCGLVAMPFRVVGSVAKHTYQAGKSAVAKTSKDKKSAKPDPAAKPGKTDAATKPTPGNGNPQAPNPQDPTNGNVPEPPPNPNVPVPPADLPTMPGDILPPLPEDLPPP